MKVPCHGLCLLFKLGSHSSSPSNELLPSQSGSWNKVDTARSTYDLASLWAQYQKQQKWRYGHCSGSNDASWGSWTHAWIRSKTVQPHGRRLWTSVNLQPLINMLPSKLQITSKHHMYRYYVIQKDLYNVIHYMDHTFAHITGYGYAFLLIFLEQTCII